MRGLGAVGGLCLEGMVWAKDTETAAGARMAWPGGPGWGRGPRKQWAMLGEVSGFKVTRFQLPGEAQGEALRHEWVGVQLTGRGHNRVVPELRFELSEM